MNWELFTTFVLLTVVLVLVPGPVVTLVISTSATRGTRAALVTVAGTSTGNAILVSAIAMGLSWVLSHAIYVFEVLRWVGAVYLVYLGIKAWRSGAQPLATQADHVHFWRGLIVAVSNPKGIAFFSAFRPQFIDPTLPVSRQLAIMCAVSVLIGAVFDSCWALAAGLGRTWLLKSARAKILTRISCVALIGGGVWLSLARRPN